MDSEEPPISAEKLGEVVDALDQFGERGEALANARLRRSKDEERAVARVGELRESFQKLFDLTHHGADAKALVLVENMIARIDDLLKSRRETIENSTAMIESLIAELSPQRFPAGFLRETLTSTLGYHIREHDELVRLYYDLLAAAAEVDPDNKALPRRENESTDDYMARALGPNAYDDEVLQIMDDAPDVIAYLAR